ncbi:hypothetical protein OC861_006953 [Tilletia horrida]|nr:hypothetical protein OC861_006953 [Tilletia horrida]
MADAVRSTQHRSRPRSHCLGVNDSMARPTAADWLPTLVDLVYSFSLLLLIGIGIELLVDDERNEWAYAVVTATLLIFISFFLLFHTPRRP